VGMDMMGMWLKLESGRDGDNKLVPMLLCAILSLTPEQMRALS